MKNLEWNQYIFSFCTGVIVAGPPGSGKSTCIQTMVDALCVQSRAASRQSQHSSGKASTAASTESQHKLLRINPMVVDDTAFMFGYLGNNNDWVDGVLTHAIRKANRVRRNVSHQQIRDSYTWTVTQFSFTSITVKYIEIKSRSFMIQFPDHSKKKILYQYSMILKLHFYAKLKK